MEEMREAAAAYYANLTQKQKQQAKKFFDAMDTDGDESISLRELVAWLRKWEIVEVNNLSFFKDLDEDGDKSLDYDEVITLFYMYKTERFIFCDECGEFLKGVYYTCLPCFANASYDLCCQCYGSKKFKHHEDAVFMDNYELLRSNEWRKLQRGEEEEVGSKSSSAALEEAAAAAAGLKSSSRRQRWKDKMSRSLRGHKTSHSSRKQGKLSTAADVTTVIHNSAEIGEKVNSIDFDVSNCNIF